MEPAGSEVEVIWRGRRVRAFVPQLLAERDLTLDAAVGARTGYAASEVAHAAEALDADYEPLARLLLRSEGVASSYIEGVSAPVVDVVLAEEDPVTRHPGPAAWVASNLAAISEAVRSAIAVAPLDVATLCSWHATLMTGSPIAERHVGVIRSEQGWIGGTSPLDAHLVTPPANALGDLLDDLMSYVNRVDVDPIAQAAISHAQFEIIHPFADGNGRVGRVLVAWLLTRRLSLLVPPPVSVAIAADVAGYASGLVLYRLGDHRRWVTWFADAVTRGGRAQRTLITQVEEMKRRWHDDLIEVPRRPRSDAAVFAALDLLPRHLVLTSAVLGDELGISRKAALATLERLAAVGILERRGARATGAPGQPAALFVSRDLLGLAGASPLR
ncbi:MAG: Fic family protein [Acidobacteriota bacterium]|nr:Fic family protein [Acidobacteriota bacterium]